MSTPALIALVILLGLILAWVLHGRSVRHMTPILKRLAVEQNGKVESKNLLLMPRLLCNHVGLDVEVSNASTGIDGHSVEFTYVLFKDLPPTDFEFRILPRSIQTVADEWLGFRGRKTSTVAENRIRKLLSIRTNDDEIMEAVLSDVIQSDLLLWAGQQTNRLSDIRIYDDKLIYAVTGMPGDYGEFKLLLDTACRFVDRLINVSPRRPEASDDI